MLLSGRITLDELDVRAAESRHRPIAATSSPSGSPRPTRPSGNLQKAEKLDPQDGYVAGKASYHLGRGLELQGDTDAALSQFTHTRNSIRNRRKAWPRTWAKRICLRKKGDVAAAVLGYRRVLEPFPAPPTIAATCCRSTKCGGESWRPCPTLSTDHHFAEALTLLDRFTPMFSQTEQLELHGDTLEQWGNLD